MPIVYKNTLFVEHRNSLCMLSIWIAQNIARKAKTFTGHEFWGRADIRLDGGPGQGDDQGLHQTAFCGFPPYHQLSWRLLIYLSIDL
jgi:hypothetical protein